MSKKRMTTKSKDLICVLLVLVFLVVGMTYDLEDRKRGTWFWQDWTTLEEHVKKGVYYGDMP